MKLSPIAKSPLLEGLKKASDFAKKNKFLASVSAASLITVSQTVNPLPALGIETHSKGVQDTERSSLVEDFNSFKRGWEDWANSFKELDYWKVIDYYLIDKEASESAVQRQLLTLLQTHDISHYNNELKRQYNAGQISDSFDYIDIPGLSDLMQGVYAVFEEYPFTEYGAEVRKLTEKDFIGYTTTRSILIELMALDGQKSSYTDEMFQVLKDIPMEESDTESFNRNHFTKIINANNLFSEVYKETHQVYAAILSNLITEELAQRDNSKVSLETIMELKAVRLMIDKDLNTEDKLKQALKPALDLGSDISTDDFMQSYEVRFLRSVLSYTKPEAAMKGMIEELLDQLEAKNFDQTRKNLQKLYAAENPKLVDISINQ